MKQIIQRWLGITEIINSLLRLHVKVNNVSSNLSDIELISGRTLAKLDPQYGRSEFDLERIAESNRLADETIARLKAEAAARAPYDLPKED